MLVSIKQDLYDLGAPDTSGFPALDTDDAKLIVAAFGKDGPPVAAKRLSVKGRQFPVTVELTVDDLAFPLTKVRRAKGRRGWRVRERFFLGGGWGGLTVFVEVMVLRLVGVCVCSCCRLQEWW